MSGNTTPISLDDRVRSERATWLGSKARCWAAAQTRSRAVALT